MALKPNKMFYTIKEVSEHLDVAPSLLRYWESEFHHIRPRRTNQGKRTYSTKDVDELEKIHLLVKKKGYTLSGAKEQLRQGRKHVENDLKVIRKLENIKSILNKLKDQL